MSSGRLLEARSNPGPRGMTISYLSMTNNLQNPAYSPTPSSKKRMITWAIILAAGQSSRLAKAGLKQKKQFLEYHGYPLFWHSVLTFSRSSWISGVLIAFPPDELANCLDMVEALKAKKHPGIPVYCIGGGSLRQDSVRSALHALPDECDFVMVHDAARPFFSAGLVHRLINGFESGNGGTIPVVPCKDTVKLVRENIVRSTLARENIFLVQTPQFFPRNILVKAHDDAQVTNLVATDDASMVEKLGFQVKTVPGLEENIKITTRDDLKMLGTFPEPALPCTGLGYDVHRYGGPRPLVLGGIPIPGGPGVFAHSDGDVLIHAIVDAILGCLGQGDIGDLFPDNDIRFQGLSSSIFLSEVLHMAHRQGLIIQHMDLTVIAEVPRISPYKAQIKSNLTGLTGLGPEQIYIKATTEEKLGFTGAKQGIKAMAVVTGLKHGPASETILSS